MDINLIVSIVMALVVFKVVIALGHLLGTACQIIWNEISYRLSPSRYVTKEQDAAEFGKYMGI